MTPETPLELSLHFTSIGSNEDARLQVRVEVQKLGLSTKPHDLAIPLDDKVLADLRWYLEVYPQWPVGPDYDRALDIEAKLRAWGKTLFDAAFADREMLRVYDEFRREKNATHLITLDATDPRVLQLPWELLADEGGHLFTQRPPISIRRRLKKTKTAQTQEFTLPMRILFVVSRPEGASFLDPRSSAQALLDAIEPLGDQAIVEFLYPPTLKALTQRVRDPQLPPVHVVHFDGHGVYVPATGLGYLLFENDEHEEQLVNADKLGTLLNDTGVPLMILNAWHTWMAGEETHTPFGSVASRLIEAGIGSVLAMNYSASASAMAILTAALYGALASRKTIGQSVDAARIAMLSEPERLTLYRNDKEEAILLRDWFLPVLYQQSIDPAPFSRSLHPSVSPSTEGKRDGEKERLPAYPKRGAFPDEPLHGFHGRGRELLHLERTLAEKPIVVLHGYDGQGKTTLAAHAARWFTRKHRFERAVFVSFEHGGGLEWALSEMGGALIGDNFAIHQGDPIDAIAAELHSTPTLVVWDNFESILPNGNAPWLDTDLQNLLGMAVRWLLPSPSGRGMPKGQGGGSRLIVTTRDPSIPHTDFEPGALTAHTELPGLGRLDALELAGQILKDRGIPRPPREKLAELLDFLGCHPLSIQLVVPHLRNNTPEGLIAEFDELLPGFTAGKGKERNESLRVSLDFSLRSLGEETRKVLPDLAVFQGGAMEAQILKVTQFKPSTWRRIRDELARAALLSIDQGAGIGLHTDEGDFDGYYVRFHPTLIPYLASQLAAERNAELAISYKHTYFELAHELYELDSTELTMEVRALVMRELLNMKRAGTLLLESNDDLEQADVFIDYVGRFLRVFGRSSELEDWMRNHEKTIQSRLPELEVSLQAKLEYRAKDRQRELSFQQGQYLAAEKICREMLKLVEAHPDLANERAQIMWNIGRCITAEGKPSQAIEWYQRALQLIDTLEPSGRLKRLRGNCNCGLGDAFRELGRYDESRNCYEEALKIDRELIYGRGMVYDLLQIGILALRQNDLTEARHRCLEARTRFHQMGELQMEAEACHQLGMVAQEAQDWAEAERYYKESLSIKERIGAKALAAITCNELALVAKGADRLDEAEQWYKLAIEGFRDTAQTRHEATASSSLANLYLAQDRLDEAEQFAHRAQEIKETLDLSLEPWKTYNILAEIAEKRGRVEEARGWRKKEKETRRAFDEQSGYQTYGRVLQQFDGVIKAVIAAVNGDANARTQIEASFEMFRKGNWQIVDAIQRIWNGERDAEALTENIGPDSAGIVWRILGLLNQPLPPTPPPSTASTGEGSAASPSSSQGDHGPRSEAEGGGRGDGQGITLEDVLNLVVAGARGDHQAGGQAYQIAQALQQPNAPPEYRALGKGLQNVLEGLRGDEAVQGLPPEAAQIVRGALAQLE